MFNVRSKFFSAFLLVIFLFQIGEVLAEKVDEVNSFQIQPTDEEKEVIVMYKNEDGKAAILQKSTKVLYKFETISAISVLLKREEIHSLIENPNIISIEENEEVEILGDNFEVLGIVDEIHYMPEESQWSIQKMGMKNAWNEGYEGAGVKIGIY